MLVLSRQKGQAIRIGNDIKVVVVRLAKGQVALAIEAPRSIPIDREEIYLSKKESVKNKIPNKLNIGQ